VAEALKRLNALVDLGSVHSVVSGGRNFYTVTGTESTLKSSRDEGEK